MRKVASAVLCAGVVVAGSLGALASEAKPKAAQDAATKTSPWTPKIQVPKIKFQINDRLAALEAIQFALTEVADGSTFVWHRPHSSLSGRVSPTESFLDTDGKVCRHLKFELSARALTRQIEGVACREKSGLWALNG